MKVDTMIALVLLVIVGAIAPQVSGGQLYFFTRPLAWQAAENECKRLGGHLATVQSLQQNQVILNELRKRHMDNTWIGLNDNIQEGSFKWIGTNSCFLNFKSTEPNGHRAENCVEFVLQWGGKWNDKSCSVKRPFVCEKSANTRQVVTLFTRALTWQAAENECNKWGGQLATVRSLSQNQGMVNELRKRHMSNAWIGLNDNSHEGEFKWIGSSTCFYNFKSTEPNGNRGENCVEFVAEWNGKWNDQGCSSKRPFVCEKSENGRNVLTAFTRQLAWQDAENECKRQGGHLAIVRSQQENQRVLNELRKKRLNSGWIGLTDNDHEGLFKWIGSNDCFDNFKSGEPNGKRIENCVELVADWGGKWNDERCTSKRPFFCEKSAHIQNGNWGAWQSFGVCSKSCGGGVQTRSRSCNNPAPAYGGTQCCGKSLETRPCNTAKCVPHIDMGGGQLYFFTKPLSWQAAENECKKLGAHLATVHSVEQNQVILNELRKRHMGSTWIGLNDNIHEGSFKWIGTNSCFLNFKSTEPNGHRAENCVEFVPQWGGKWNDKSCSAKRPFVCEKSANIRQVVTLFTRPLAWQAAENECKRWGGHLATVTSLKENQGMVNELKKRHISSAWIGLNDNSHEGEFKWIDPKGCFYNFKSTEPNGNRGENCVEFVAEWNGLWNDQGCSNPRPFVCEKSEHGRNVLTAFTRQLAWQDAENECKRRGGHLATVRSQQENQLVLNELRKRRLNSGWIGLTDNDHEGLFKWIGSNDCFDNFKSGEPNGKRNENCVEVVADWGGKWNDEGCTDKRPFFCEKSARIQNGNWGAWQSYGACSKPCGGGVQTRSRSCNNPAPAYGGTPCCGKNSETRVCNTGTCAVNGNWGAWKSFSACSKSCGGGVQTRSRSCNNPAPAHGGKSCSGKSTETRACATNSCAVNGNWSPWRSYGKCSKFCGDGIASRSRTCTNPAPSNGGSSCSGKSSETKTCNVEGNQCPGYGWCLNLACQDQNDGDHHIPASSKADCLAKCRAYPGAMGCEWSGKACSIHTQPVSRGSGDSPSWQKNYSCWVFSKCDV